MGWVRLEDSFYDHPKIARVSPSAVALWIMSIAWCNQHLTDGVIPVLAVNHLARYPRRSQVIDQLLNARLWCLSPDGESFIVHDYLEYQFSREQVYAQREMTRKRVANLRAKRESNGVTRSGPETSNGVTSRRGKGARTGVTDEGVTPPQPNPRGTPAGGTPPYPPGGPAAGDPAGRRRPGRTDAISEPNGAVTAALDAQRDRDRQAAADCPRCDEYGWIDDAGGARRCDHQPVRV